MRKSKILIIEDEEDMRRVLLWRFRKEGSDVEACGDISSAIMLLKEKSFDLIVSDIVMSGKSGYEGITEFRSVSPAPIVLMSGTVTPDMRIDAELLGAAALVEKSGDCKELLTTIEKLMK